MIRNTGNSPIFLPNFTLGWIQSDNCTERSGPNAWLFARSALSREPVHANLLIQLQATERVNFLLRKAHPSKPYHPWRVRTNVCARPAGYVRVSYEFEGFDQYADKKKAEQDKSY